MLDLGWTELLVIGIVALIVVGPKDLPVLFRNVGRFVGRMKGMAREFSTAMNQAADEAGVKDIQKSLKSASQPLKSAMDGVKDATASLKDFDPETETGKLAADRAEQARQNKAAAARTEADRKAKEAAAAAKRAEAAEAELSSNAPAEASREDT